MPTIYIDIETLPALDWTEDQITEYVRAEVPGNYKKPESIDAWVAENRLNVWSRTALDWRHAKILCIAWAFDDEALQVVAPNVERGGANPLSEATLLDVLYRSILGRHPADWKTLCWCGHFIKGFDLPLIYYRALRSHRDLARLMPWDRLDQNRIDDTTDLWLVPNRKGGHVHLDDICQFLGLKTKEDSGLDGAHVYEAWVEGRIDEIARYCMDDVERVRQVHRALVPRG